MSLLQSKTTSAGPTVVSVGEGKGVGLGSTVAVGGELGVGVEGLEIVEEGKLHAPTINISARTQMRICENLLSFIFFSP